MWYIKKGIFSFLLNDGCGTNSSPFYENYLRIYIKYPQPKGWLLKPNDSSSSGMCYPTVILGTDPMRTNCPSVSYLK